MILLIHFKDLPGRTGFEKVLRDKTFNIAKNPKYNGYQCGLASIVYKFFDKKSAASNTSRHAYNSKCMSNQQLADKLENFTNY